MMINLLLILSAVIFLSSLLLTYFLIKIMPRLGVVDRPGPRNAHKNITPRAGGLALVIVFTIALYSSEYIIFSHTDYSFLFLQIFLPLALISLWDDFDHVFIPFRLLIHIISCILAVMWLIHPNQILHGYVSEVFDLIIGSFALLSFINVYNFMDGIDGITSYQSLHLSLTMLLLCWLRGDIIPYSDYITIISIILIGFASAFLIFNWSPAKIFLGDVGSVSLGFIIGVCMLIIGTASEKLFLACVIASLYYIADGALTIIIRLAKGEKIWLPHLDHFFQKAVKKGMKDSEVVIRIAKCNSLLMLLAVNCLFYPIISLIIALISVAIILFRSV